MEAPSIPPKAERAAAPDAEADAHKGAPSAIDGTAEAAVPPEPELESQKVIHIKPPIIVKELATQLGLKPHQLIAELMTFNIFANINQTIEPDIASKICENHGFVLEKERREKGAGVHKIEQVVVAPPKPVIEEAEIQQNLGEFPGGLTDQGERPQTPLPRKKKTSAKKPAVKGR